MNALEKLNRQAAMKANMDSKGVQWGISLVEGTALYKVGIAPDSGGPIKVPERYPHVNGEDSKLSGMFTRTEYAQKAIEDYLNRDWDFCEQVVLKNARKEYKKDVISEAVNS